MSGYTTNGVGYQGEVGGTSHSAALSLPPINESQEIQLLHNMFIQGNGTAREVLIRTGLNIQNTEQGARMRGLKIKGWVEPTGEKRRNSTGRMAEVLRITPAGEAVIRGL